MNKIYKSEESKQVVLNKYQEILDSWPVENDQYKINTVYGETFVIESGSKEKPPLVLIHGSVANSFCWIGDVEKLSKTHNVYAIDIIGEAGYSEENRPKYESGDYPKWINNVFEELGLKSASMVGLSLGGWMSLSFAVKYPGKVDNLVLLCPGGLHSEKSSFLWKAIFLSLFGKWGSNQITKIINGDKLPDANDVGLKSALEFTALISKNFNPRMDKLPIYTGSELKNLIMPTLVLYGDTDHMLSADASIDHIKKHARNVKTILLPNTGHVIANQTERILEFING